jgi:hypothetical protein
VCLDTSILWHEDKAHVVHPAFDSFWTARCDRSNLGLHVPAVVRGELLFQQTTSALKALAKANVLLDRVCSISGKKYRCAVEPSRVRADIEARFDTWIAQRAAIVEPTPVGAINWLKLIEAAIWRCPPFSANEKNPEGGEKGFRDALILETASSIAHRLPSSARFAFISGDGLLRDTAGAGFPNERCKVFESLDDFAAFLNLTEQQLTQEFVSAIQGRATSKFFVHDNSATLWYAAGIYQRFVEEFGKLFVPPSLPTQRVGVLAYWTPANNGVLRIGDARFERIVGTREFHWSSPIHYARAFGATITPLTSAAPQRSLTFDARMSSTGSASLTGLAGLPTPNNSTHWPGGEHTAEFAPHVREVTVRAHWKATVKADGRFHDVELVRLVLESERFEPATRNDQVRFGRSFVDLPPPES